MSTLNRWFGALFFSQVLAGAVSTACAAASLTPLGNLPGGDGSVAKAVSADGSTVVGYSTYNFGLNGLEAFRWTKDGGMEGLGHLPVGSFKSEANAVSADGSVIVGYSSDGAVQQAFRWTSAGGMVGLGYLPGGGSGSVANGVSADGSVIVGNSDLGPGNGFEAYRWTSGGGMVGLGNLLPPGYEGGSDALGVSADGSVIVGNSGALAASTGFEAFRWTSSSGMVGLGGLPGGSFDSGAVAVSGNGSVVVGWNYSNSSSGSDYEAFRWTSDGGMVGLGHLFEGEIGEATGASADGSVIVGYSLFADYEAIRWTSDGGMQRLWDVMLDQGVNPAADGWERLLQAHGISADGNTIVGQGVRNGSIEAFVAVVPEPTSIGLMFPLAAAALRRRRTRASRKTSCPGFSQKRRGDWRP